MNTHLLTEAQTQPFVAFVLERLSIWRRRKWGAPAPWTTDPILQAYRFCNVYRELDTVTAWVREHWRSEYAEHEDLWFAMCVARLVNLPSTLGKLTPLPWDPSGFVGTLDAIASKGERMFSAAYMVTTHGHAVRKPEFMAHHVLSPLWAERRSLRPQVGESLAAYHKRLSQRPGLGKFLAAQIIADLKHVSSCPLSHAPDWYTWAAPGPGSLRGLSRVLGRGTSRGGYAGGEWLRLVNQLQEHLQPHLSRKGWHRICAQDVQNCLCEFDKYERARLGEGTPKQRFRGN